MKYPDYKIYSTIFFFVTLLYYKIAFAQIRALNTAATGMAVQESSVNTISNNIANANTNGFKKSRTESEDLMYQTVQEAGARSSAITRYNIGVQIGSGAKVSAIRKEFSQGSAKLTNNPFDLMINGEGFFALVTANNEVRYTRDGAFNVNAQGNIVSKHGNRLFPGFTVPPNIKSINISKDGLIEAFLANQTEALNLGRIPVFTFINPSGLKSAGMNLYSPSQASGIPMQQIAGNQNVGVITQGALETSNVNIMNEMTNLIRAQRAYELNAKVMGVADQMLQTVNTIR